jgi:hypothetical protein
MRIADLTPLPCPGIQPPVSFCEPPRRPVLLDKACGEDDVRDPLPDKPLSQRTPAAKYTTEGTLRKTSLLIAAVLVATLSGSAPAFAAPSHDHGGNESMDPNAMLAAKPAPKNYTSGGVTTASCGSPCNLPFNYVISFTHQVNGRNMQTTTSKFCNWFTSSYAPGTSQIVITLWNVSTKFASVSFPTNGSTYYYCWGPGFANNDAGYYFVYTKSQDGKEVDGSGQVTAS